MVRCWWRGPFPSPTSCFKGCDSPLTGFSFDKLAGSKPSRVGLHEVVWGLGGRNARQDDGCRESEVSRGWGDRRYGLLALAWVQCPYRAIARGMQRGRAASPLAEVVLYYKTHLAFHACTGSGHAYGAIAAGTHGASQEAIGYVG